MIITALLAVTLAYAAYGDVTNEEILCAILSQNEAIKQCCSTSGGSQAPRELTSCKNIKQANPSSPSAFYPSIEPSGNMVNLYCNMGTLCGSDEGWTRIGYLDTSEKCPPNFEEYTKDTGGVRTCRRRTDGCNSVIFSSHNISYTEICGRVVGYQYASPDAVLYKRDDINTYYVDGVAISRGSPRNHVWTYMGGPNQNGAEGINGYQCPCNVHSTQTVQDFIGNDWYCESGNSELNTWSHKAYMSDALWDGENCEPDEVDCCKQKVGQPSPPWFHKTLSDKTTDYLELRICSDEGRENEDILVTVYELYIK